MKAHLLYADRDFDWSAPPPWHADLLTADLALTTVFDAMACGDEQVFEAVKKVILAGVEGDLGTIHYRQGVLEDCLNNPSVVRELYAMAGEAMDAERKHYLGSLARYPEWVLSRSIELMEVFIAFMRRLRGMADTRGRRFASTGWMAFFEMLRHELSDDFFLRAEDHLYQLKFRGGMLLSAELGRANRASRYILHRTPRAWEKAWWERLLNWLFQSKPPPHSFDIDPRDEAGHSALQDIRKRGISLVARALAQSTDHVLSFFSMLRSELAFYVGCVNLRDELVRKGEPICRPSAEPAEEHRLSLRGLYDVSLALTIERHVVGNDANADDRDLVIVTGANQGGKSTFLRSIGLAQLMMQAGMFAPARSFQSSTCDGLFTHYKREEDTSMESGKLDEELSRMSDIVDHIASHPMILFNESFAATNEREGSEIARQVISALLERRARMVCVTHLYELAHGFHEKSAVDVLFLRAERQDDDARTFRLVEGEPLQTSFGEDLYKDVFGTEANCDAVAANEGSR
jgi:hypothetical protein